MIKKTKIDNQEYEIIDQISVSIPDSFSKLKTGSGHGEAKLYVGQVDQVKNFWESYPNCFFFKSDLVDYIQDAQFEYKNPSQAYNQEINIEEKWNENKLCIDDLDRSMIPFSIQRSSINPPRYYITYNPKSREIWTLFRSIMLPTISNMTIFKLRNTDTSDIIFYFKPYLEYSYNDNHHDSIANVEIKKIKKSSLKETEKESLQKARIGQGVFRDKLLNEWASCIITKIDDARLLVASHIKPWSISTNFERLDHYNGLALTPTFDRLFDQGFITFKSNGKVEISDHISDRNIEKLGLKNDQCYYIPHLKNRSSYLKYHRDIIFKK